MRRSLFSYSSEVLNAIRNNKPIVALESTIVTHGMPFPSNLDMALEVEDICRQEGAVPATIAIFNKRIHVGLEKDQLNALASISQTDESEIPKHALQALHITNPKDLIKVSRRDLAYTLTKGFVGGTTVSATSWIANQANIKVFATGGIGGVHREYETFMDVSADLTELGKTPILVVCAGAKSILDLKRTSEFLETQGVPLIGYNTDELPAFFTNKSDIKLQHSCNSPQEVAEVCNYAFEQLDHSGGIVLTCPNPAPLDASLIDNAITEAQDEIKTKLLDGTIKSGNEITPLLLSRINEITNGESLHTNINLVKNNVKIASQVAVALHDRTLHSNSSTTNSNGHTTNTSDADSINVSRTNGINVSRTNGINVSRTNTCMIIGGVAVDTVATVDNKYCDEPEFRTSTPGFTSQSIGGVAFNIAKTFSLLSDDKPRLIAAVGEDEKKSMITQNLQQHHIEESDLITFENASTPSYTAILSSKGDLQYAIADMSINENLQPSSLQHLEDDIKRAPIVIIDGNIPTKSYDYIADLVQEKSNNILVYEPTSIAKALLPLKCKRLPNVMTPSVDELNAIAEALSQDKVTNIFSRTDIEKVATKVTSTLVHEYQSNLQMIVTCGSLGCLLCELPHYKRLIGDNQTLPLDTSDYKITWFDVVKVDQVVNCTGAGDTLCGALCFALSKGKPMDEAIKFGMKAASVTVGSPGTVPDDLHLKLSNLD